MAHYDAGRWGHPRHQQSPEKVQKAENKDGEIKVLHAKIVQLAVESFFVTRAEAVSISKRQEMIRTGEFHTATSTLDAA
jgi:hypothetical protein